MITTIITETNPGQSGFVSEGRQSWGDAHQSAQQFTAEGCAAAVLHGESHLVEELLQSIHTFRGLTGHLAEQDTHARR